MCWGKAMHNTRLSTLGLKRKKKNTATHCLLTKVDGSNNNAKLNSKQLILSVSYWFTWLSNFFMAYGLSYFVIYKFHKINVSLNGTA